MVRTPITAANIRLCLTVKRNRSDSLPARPTAAVAMAMDCGEIILPVTPPVVLAATVSTSGRPSCCAVVACKVPNKALADVSEPVRNTPTQPRKGEKKENALPVCASASASVADRPE